MEARSIRLPGRRLLTVRPVEDGDGPGLKELFVGLGEDDLYRRFFSAHPPPDRFIQKMTTVAGRGGFGVVGILESPEAPPRLVAEAGYAPLPDGEAELGITVAAGLRGWLGPFLLDVLVEEARSQGIPNLQAEVLVTNRRMMSLLESRGAAVLDCYDGPAIVRVRIGTGGRTPVWPARKGARRVLAEVPGGRWRHADAVREAGLEVMVCPGRRNRLAPCPEQAGQSCPLAAAADVIVDGVPGDGGLQLLEAHRRLHAGVPVCLDFATDAPSAEGVTRIGNGMPKSQVVALLQRLAARPAGSELPES